MKKVNILVLTFLIILLSGCAMSPEEEQPQQRDYLNEGYQDPLTENFGDSNGKITSTDGTADYALIENPEVDATDESTSTFSIDVDTASYSLFRKFINYDQMPPIDDIRTEEMINYFDYSYDQPVLDQPFSIETTYSECPWNSDKDLLMIGIQGKEIEYIEAPTNNLVFLIDVSGSMRADGKLDMVKESLALLVDNLREEDHVSIVTYAGTAEIVLFPTSGDNKQVILDTLNGLEAGGGTNGSGGIELAYNVANQTFIEDGNNRVLLATDGDFNIGTTTTEGLIKIVTEKAEIGIYLTILGFGGNHHASYMMENLSNDGQGNYYFIDTLAEADKVLNHEITSTIVAIADDVKIQIEFNSDLVSSYRLIGYENRVMDNDSFDDDTKDAGEIGAGHDVTAFYEIELKDNSVSTSELATIRIRYKNPGEDQSKLIEGIVRVEDYDSTPNSDYLFATAIIETTLVLKDSEYKGNADINAAIDRIEENLGDDEFGLRQEFLDLVITLRSIMRLDNENPST